MPQQGLTKSQKIIFIVIAIIILIVVLMLLGIIPGLKSQEKNPPSEMPAITLEFWGIDNSDAFKSVLEGYQTIYPNVTINYQQIDEADYENKLLNALAAQKGPDIIMIKHNWVPKHLDKLYPSSISIKDLKAGFVDVTADDLYYQGKIWALPLYVDTLALYYNKDFFNTAGIAMPPATWDEFVKDAQLLTKKNSSGEILQAGAALGTVNNIKNAVDIVLLLMLHNNQKIVDENGRGIFDTANGVNAVNFYLSFANPASPNYSWNVHFPNAVEAFAQNKLAMMIDYSSAISTLNALNAYLNYGIAPLPQPANTITKQNYADYWAFTVSATSKHPQQAWDFIYYLVDKGAVEYLNSTLRPAANRVLIQACKNDEKLGVFCEQALTAKTWLQFNPEENTNILKNMLESILDGRATPLTALHEAAQRINRSASQF